METTGDADKRFVLSREQFAKHRIDGVKEVVDILKEEKPEVLSFCMFGSMVKGTAKEASDIDGYLFVDAAKLVNGDNLVQIEDKEHGVKMQFREETKGEYEDLVKNRLQEKLDLSDEQVKHVRVMPIDDQIIDRGVESLVEWAKGSIVYEQRQKERKPYFENKNLNWEDAPEHIQIPDYVGPPTNLTAMFHLEVGGGVVKYRKYLINKLNEMGGVGEKIWESVIGGTEMLEQNLSLSSGKKYPRTLDEAKEIYGG